MTALDRLWDDLPKPRGESLEEWLDRHEEDMVAVLDEKGVELTAHFLGTHDYLVEKWAALRGHLPEAAPGPYNVRVARR